MPALSPREKRTLRLAGIGLAIYLVLFLGWRQWRALETGRVRYQRLQTQAAQLQRDLHPYENRVLLTQKLKERFQLEPRALSRATVVADASAAIQRVAKSGGVQVGPIRESPARASAKELASIQLEATGPVPSVVALLHRVESLGYPLVVDAVQLVPEPAKPGTVKLSLTIVILDFDQWKEGKVPHA